MEEFWAVIRQQITELTGAKTADDVVRILAVDRNPNLLDNPEWANAAGDAFFAGSGGDDTVEDALYDAGWRELWRQAHYYWAMQAPDGSVITYVEGDVYRGDRRG